MELLRERHLAIRNVDAVVLAQKPKLSPWKGAIRASLARAMGVDERRVNVKASTSEGLGFIGRGEGIAAQAAVLLDSRRS